MLVESRVHVSVVVFPSVMSNRLVSGVMEGGLNTVEWRVNNFKLHERVCDFGNCVLCLCNMYMKVHCILYVHNN